MVIFDIINHVEIFKIKENVNFLKFELRLFEYLLNLRN
jgi:hypothetical protein